MCGVKVSVWAEWNLIFRSTFMRRFHFWSQFYDNFPSDGDKKLPVTPNLKMGFLRFSLTFRALMHVLTADSGSTQKVTSIRTFWTWFGIFGGKCSQNQDFWQKPDFALHEQHNALWTEPTPDSGNSCSKVLVVNWNSVFFLIFKIHYVRHTLLPNFEWICRNFDIFLALRAVWLNSLIYHVSSQWQCCRISEVLL